MLDTSTPLSPSLPPSKRTYQPYLPPDLPRSSPTYSPTFQVILAAGKRVRGSAAALDFAPELERLATAAGSADQAKFAVRALAAVVPEVTRESGI